jgi:hypothetical protein
MIELLLPYGFDTLEYSWVKAIIGMYTLADYSVAKKCQQFTFYTKAKDRKSQPQNSGVRVDALDNKKNLNTYYGYIDEIWELTY